MCLVCGCTQVSGDYVFGTARQRLAGSVAVPRGDDGRPASLVAEEQAPWGWGLAPLFLPVEVISHCIRPVSLSVRLFCNIACDHLVMAVFVGLFPLLICELQKQLANTPYRRAEFSWVLEDNRNINQTAELAGARRYKTYRIYEKSIG